MKDLLFGEYETFDEAVEGLKKKIKENMKNPRRISFCQHIPAFVDFQDTPPMIEDYIVGSFEELLERNKHKLSKDEVFATDGKGHYLMTASTVKKFWWTLGTVGGIDLRTRLPRYDEVYKGDKEGSLFEVVGDETRGENETADNANDQ